MRSLKKKRARSRLAEEYLAWEKERPLSSSGRSDYRRRSSPSKHARDSQRKSQHSHGAVNGNGTHTDQEAPPKKKSRHTLRRRSPHENIAVEYKSKKPPDRSKRKSKHSHTNSDVRKASPQEKSRHTSTKPSRHSISVESTPKKSSDRSKRKSRYSPTSSDTYVNRNDEFPVEITPPKKSPDRQKRRSKHHQVNSDACLDRLPMELKLSILEALPDVPSLYSITRASPAFYQAYLGRRYRIHSRVITADVDSEILIEALSLLQASRISRSTHWLEKASSFINLYEIDRSLRVGPEITGKETMHRIAGFHFVVHTMTSTFSQDALANHPIIGRSSFKSEKTLSSTETRRFQRALYRYEIFCRLFGGLHRTPEEYAHDQTNFARIATDFLASFQPWEAEEMNCVHRYICKYYRRVIRKCTPYLNVEFGRTKYDEKVVIRAPNGQYQYKLERDWVKEAAERCASMGLRLLDKVMSTSASKSRARLLHNPIFSIDISGEIIPLVWKKSYSLDFGPGPVFSAYGKPDLQFVSEREGPNSGIVWAGAMTFSLRSEWPNKDWLQSWAYVMWDRDRLDRWGVLKGGYRYIAETIAREEESYNVSSRRRSSRRV